MSDKKDVWDKADVLLRALVPISVGLMLLFWNSQRTSQQTSATMTEIAVGILATERVPDQVDALRLWAIDVLKDPEHPPRLSENAAKQLELEGLPIWSVKESLSSSAKKKSFSDFLKESETDD